MTTSDKTLLELAAKAAGIDVQEWRESYEAFKLKEPMLYWNPLTDDGDALRLAVKLRLRFSTVCNQGDYAVASATDFDTYARVEAHKGDPYAATRRAIVKAAAMIGESL